MSKRNDLAHELWLAHAHYINANIMLSASDQLTHAAHLLRDECGSDEAAEEAIVNAVRKSFASMYRDNGTGTQRFTYASPEVKRYCECTEEMLVRAYRYRISLEDWIASRVRGE